MDGLNRRDFVGLAGTGLLAAQWLGTGASAQADGPHGLPPLPYAPDALEPHYDRETVTLHHGKHHAGYVKGLNAAEGKLAEALKSGDFAAAKELCKALAFHGSGHLLHSLFWANMKPAGGGEPTGGLAAGLTKAFGSYAAFRGLFLAAANSVEGSGWAILAHRPLDDRLVVLQAEKHENLTQWGVAPILALDVWEHAYYLKYQNKRVDYLAAWFKTVDWKVVAERHAKAGK